MKYAEYVALAYAVFVLVLLWDFIAPRLQLRQYLRQARKQIQRRQHAAHPGITPTPSATLSEKGAK